MIDHNKYFSILNERLKNSNQSLTLYTVGGFALKCFGIKTTMDVDAFYDANDTIERIIDDVGKEYNINPMGEHWVNKAVAYLKDPRVKNPGKEFSELLIKLSNLEVYRANIDYLLVMKTFAVFDNKKDKIKHLDDCIKILKSGKVNIKTEKDFIEIFEKYGYKDIEDLKETIREILKNVKA